jgi:type IV pilus assembly protein PilB
MSNPQQISSEDELAAEEKVEFQLSVQIDPDLIKSFPADVARDFGVLPLGRFGEKSLVLAADEELSPGRLKELRKRLGGQLVHIVSSAGSDVRALAEGVFDGAAGGGEKEDQPSDSIPTEEPNPEALEYVEQSQYNTEPKKLSEILVDLGFLSEEELESHLKEQKHKNRPHFDPSSFIDAKVLRLIPEATAREHRILPLSKVMGDLLVASAGYPDASLVSEIRQVTGLMPKLILTDAEELEVGIKECYERRHYLRAEEMRLGDYLLAEGFIDKKQLDICLREQKTSKEKLGELLVRHGYVSEDVTFMYLAEKLGYEYRRFATGDIDLELSKLISQRFAQRNLVLPLVVDYETKEVDVAMVEPYDLKVIDSLKSLLDHHGYKLKPVLSSPANLKEGIGYLYNFQGLVEDEVEMETISIDAEHDRKDLVATEDIPQIRRIINQVLYRAVVESASDIHIENLENRIRVRFRLDGLLQERKVPITKENIRSVISVFKVDAGLDITEHRRSQDGVFKMSIGKGRFVDFRINLHNTDFGQDAVIRILDTAKNLLPLEALGCPPRMLERYLLLVENPQGLILLTGPTGSGKSTTLYSTLAHLNSAEKKIVTAEDPVEYYLDGICQYKVNEAIGNTFAEYARRFLRKDPDIVLIGEIRDEDTAEACFRAAMTGHLVFSTLHTNDSVGALQRLSNLGVDNAIAGEAILAVMAQRLARRVCTKCRQHYGPDPALLSLFYPDGRPEGVEFVSGAGCAACDYLGFKGRMGLYEYWELNPEVVLAIHKDPGNVREMARRTGLMSMVEDGLNKVQQGITTLEELRRVVPLDQIRYYTNYEYGKEKPKVKGGRRKAKRKKPVEKVGKVEEAGEDDTIDWPLVVHPK